MGTFSLYSADNLFYWFLGEDNDPELEQNGVLARGLDIISACRWRMFELSFNLPREMAKNLEKMLRK